MFDVRSRRIDGGVLAGTCFVLSAWIAKEIRIWQAVTAAPSRASYSLKLCDLPASKHADTISQHNSQCKGVRHRGEFVSDGFACVRVLDTFHARG